MLHCASKTVGRMYLPRLERWLQTSGWKHTYVSYQGSWPNKVYCLLLKKAKFITFEIIFSLSLCESFFQETTCLTLVIKWWLRISEVYSDMYCFFTINIIKKWSIQEPFYFRGQLSGRRWFWLQAVEVLILILVRFLSTEKSIKIHGDLLPRWYVIICAESVEYWNTTTMYV